MPRRVLRHSASSAGAVLRASCKKDLRKSANADLIAHLLQAFSRDPGCARLLYAGKELGNLTVVLRFAIGRPVRLRDSSLRGPAVAAQLESAAAWFVRQVFFREGATHYELLGLAPDASGKSVQENYRLLMQLIHPDRSSAEALWPKSFAARANIARTVLKDAKARADYDARLLNIRGGATARLEVVADQVQEMPQDEANGLPYPVPVRVVRRGPPLYPSTLPEWLTAGVGGFARTHPAAVVLALAALVSAAVIVSIVLSEPDEVLTRVESDPAPTSEAKPWSASGSRSDTAISVMRAEKSRSKPLEVSGNAPR